MNMKWRKMSGFFAMMVVLSLGLCGCGGSDSKEESTEKTSAPAATEASATEEPEAGSEEETETSDSGEDEDIYEYLKNNLDTGRMGLTENGEGVYYAATSDCSTCLLVFADPESAKSANFVGPASITEGDDGEYVTITDNDSGNSITFSVTQQEDGTWILDMGDLGMAAVEDCTVSECVDAFKAIDEGTVPVF